MTISLTVDTEHPIIIPSGPARLDGLLHVPKNATGVVLFAHGSGSSRFSKRNQFVANVLNQAKLATLLFDLLTPEEEEIDDKTREFRFDIEFLAIRLIDALNWIRESPIVHDLPMGLFGASTGGGAALVAAAKEPKKVKAVVSRGGRPDLANESLSLVTAPVLLLVGGKDEQVIELNKQALEKLQSIKQLDIVPGATHLFEEPGTLEEVARLAKDWFVKYLT